MMSQIQKILFQKSENLRIGHWTHMRSARRDYYLSKVILKDTSTSHREE